MAKLKMMPISLADANDFVMRHHRHHTRAQGHKFSMAAVKDGEVVGVVIVGRPVSRHRDDGSTLEVTRLATDGTRNACSFLYAKAAKGAFALGYDKIGTYILDTEPGSSLRAVGWEEIGVRGGGTWNNAKRPRIDKHPLQKKILFECTT